MIRINDDLVVEVGTYPCSYTLKRDMHREEKSRDGKSMVPVYNTVGYSESLSKALDRAYEEIIKDKLKDGEHPIEEALQIIRECTEEWRRLCEGVLNV
jgi:hypothetical protein